MNWEVYAALAAVVAGVWGHLQAAKNWLHSMVVARCWVDQELGEILTSYLAHHASHSARERAFGVGHYNVRPLGRHAAIAYEDLPRMRRRLWLGRCPVWVEHTKEPPSEEYPVAVTYLRGTLVWDELVCAALEWGGSHNSNRASCANHKVIYHYGKTLGSEIAKQRDQESPTHVRGVTWGHANGWRPLRWTLADIGPNDPQAFANLALTADLEPIVAEVRLWHSSAAWYSARGLCWRRGYLLHGEPGTGKTSWARAVAEDLDLPVHVLDLASMSNEDLRDAWSEAMQRTPCMILIEDIDAVFHGRDNVSRGGGMMSSGGLSFDALLNCIDGVERTDGVLLVVTSNRLELIDDALANRPGRVDRKVKFGLLDYGARLVIAKRIIADPADAERLALEAEDVPAARFVEACCRRAIAERYAAVAVSEEPYR